METHICQACGREWVRKKVRGTRPKYCPECRKRRTTIRNCAVCGVRVLKTRRRERVVCSYACRTILQHGYIYPRREDWERARRAERAAPKKDERHRPRFVSCRCAGCGTYFVIEWQLTARFCSKKCSKRINRDRRRAREAGGWVEDIDRWEIFEADSFVCKLCGEETDPGDFEWTVGSDGRAAFVAGSRYPTLDHIVPLSKGGTHSRSNVQTAHLACNAEKRDVLMAAATAAQSPSE